MTTQFPVRAAAFQRDEDLGTEYVLLAEQPDGDGRRLEIQRSIEPTDSDREQGMDTYCLVDESGACHYGGVRGWRVRSGQVEIELTPPAAEVLRTDGYALQLLGQFAPPDVVVAGLDALIGPTP